MSVLAAVMILFAVSVTAQADDCARDCKGCNGSENCEACLAQCRAGGGTGTNLFPVPLLFNDLGINMTNTGDLGADVFGPGSSAKTGSVCANVYVFSPDEQEIACCYCLVTPNALVHLTTRDLIGNVAFGVAPSSVVVKLVATVPGVGPPQFRPSH
jgi:hypothetical protein